MLKKLVIFHNSELGDILQYVESMSSTRVTSNSIYQNFTTGFGVSFQMFCGLMHVSGGVKLIPFLRITYQKNADELHDTLYELPLDPFELVGNQEDLINGLIEFSHIACEALVRRNADFSSVAKLLDDTFKPIETNINYCEEVGLFVDIFDERFHVPCRLLPVYNIDCLIGEKAYENIKIPPNVLEVMDYIPLSFKFRTITECGEYK